MTGENSIIKVRALSMKQPWATWLALGIKTIETRMWSTRHRGPLLICASKSWDNSVPPDHMGVNLHPRAKDALYPMGFAVAVAFVSDCRPMRDEDEPLALCPNEPGRFAWTISSVVQIRPFNVKGSLGLFDVEVGPDVQRAVADARTLADVARSTGISQYLKASY